MYDLDGGEELKIRKCTKEDIKEKFNSSKYAKFQGAIARATYCLEDPSRLTMQGTFLESNFTIPVISVNRCQGEGCKDPKEIDELL